MTGEEQVEARERLLDVLLEEELARDERAERQESAGAPPPSGSRATSPWLIAAALVVGIGAVVATAMMQHGGKEADAHAYSALPPQDPQEPGIVKVRDVEHFKQLLQRANAIELVRQEIVGAGRIDDKHGSADRLDLEPWPEKQRFDKGAADGLLAKWTAALAGSLDVRERQQSVNDIMHLVIELPKNRRARLFVSIDGDATYFSVDDDEPFVASPELRKLLVDANDQIKYFHKRFRGIIDSLDDVRGLPSGADRVECPVPEQSPAEAVALLQRLSALRTLSLRGNASAELLLRLADLGALEALELDGTQFDAARLEALQNLTRLRSLTLRNCTGLDAAALRGFRTFTALRRLNCIDTPLGQDGAGLQELVSLPALREFGLRARALELTQDRLQPLVHTKLARLMLVDVHATGHDLAVLRGLPSLVDLSLVTPINDDDLDSLIELSTLQRLMIRNARVSPAGARAFRAALPGCRLDWRPDARFFDTLDAFRQLSGQKKKDK